MLAVGLIGGTSTLQLLCTEYRLSDREPKIAAARTQRKCPLEFLCGRLTKSPCEGPCLQSHERRSHQSATGTAGTHSSASRDVEKIDSANRSAAFTPSAGMCTGDSLLRAAL